MIHARNEGSLSQSRSTGRWEHCPHRPHGETMGGAWPEHTLRFGRTLKKRKTKRGRGGVKEMREKTPERNRRRGRKSYPLRGRGGSSEEEGLSCHVLLTRLEEDIREQEDINERGNDSPTQPPVKPESRIKKLGKGKGKAKGKLLAKKMIPQMISKTTSDVQESLSPEPRKRRLASLNAEAVNSLLLERPNETQPAGKQARRQQEEPSNGESTLGTDPARGGVARGPKAPRASSSKASILHKPELCRRSKKAKKVSKKLAKPDRGEKKETAMMTLQMLHTPAPRRLAGLNAAALLKLTSTSATSKQRVKPTSTTTTDCKTTASVDVKQKQPRLNLKQCGRQPKQKGRKLIPEQGGCSACKKSNFEPKVEWESGGCTHRLTKPGYQSRSMLAYPLKPVVKEEQVETELSPYYCCPPEGSVEYCHRLALFLGQKAYADSEEQPLNSAMTSMKRECLVTSPSVAHPHSHAALTLSPCLCTADPACFSSYYVHIAHPGAPSTTLSSRPLNFVPSTMCPGRVSGSKLLGPPVSHASTLAHPAFCGSVGSPYYSKACRVSGYTYRAMQPVNSRGCSFSTGCSGFTHGIKTGELMMSLFWYYRPEHTQGGQDSSMHCEKEIFASRHQDENSVACIEDRCYVLPLAQYCRFCALVKRREEGAPPGTARVVPCPSDFNPPDHRQVPANINPELVYLCRHVYDFRYGRILKNLQ
ncbi:bromo adjacent homology domain-containing 1 protein isoform X2 [Salmo trutta]|uniref:bromo adjacent homology domain-containing 1 protein isoform X2 n=1 Tax=Salmo trutta TaxID=8032 RepID=UPI001130766D|nr:bromo adjacent homology domain-containing 1 protein-like isoform X2 [Salmo trutta]